MNIKHKKENHDDEPCNIDMFHAYKGRVKDCIEKIVLQCLLEQLRTYMSKSIHSFEKHCPTLGHNDSQKRHEMPEF